jgi:hypothetical protein
VSKGSRGLATGRLVADIRRIVGLEMYLRNPFRILGLPVGAKRKEIETRAQRLCMGFDRSSLEQVLPLVPVPSADQVMAAARELANPAHSFVWRLFWFFPSAAGGDSDEALSLLSIGDEAGAAEVWQGRIGADECGGLAAHNLAVLYHLLALDLEWVDLHPAGRHKQGDRLRDQTRPSAARIQRKRAWWDRSMAEWSRLAAHEAFWARLAADAVVTGLPWLNAVAVTLLRASLMSILLGANAALAVRACVDGREDEAALHVGVLRGAGVAPQDLERVGLEATEPARVALRLAVARAEEQTKQSPEQVPGAVRELLGGIGPHLRAMDLLLAPENPVRVGMRDEVALKILALQVRFAKQTAHWAASVGLLKEALSLAAGQSASQCLQKELSVVTRNALAATLSKGPDGTSS